MTTEEMIEVMRHHADGGTVQMFYKTSGQWAICKEPLWNWVECEYRINPQPREFWASPAVLGLIERADYEKHANDVLFREVIE